ncbi:MAG: four helix bundle protein [Planctomycetes bacterium]|nr:four helix bundle protein [Planctomycetota bacterium]
MSEPIKSYRDLIAWQKAYALGKAVYQAAGQLPEAERFGLMSSLRRIGTGIASHIAQGYGRGNTPDYIWFLKQARGELYVLDTQLLFCLDFKYVLQGQYTQLKSDLDESERVLAGLIRSLGG